MALRMLRPLMLAGVALLAVGCGAGPVSIGGRVVDHRGTPIQKAEVVTEPGGLEPDHDTAFAIVKHAVEHGLMMFGPVGTGGGTVKLCPPLCITPEQLAEGLDVLEETFDAVCVGR